jgi:hypothetical protein
VLVPVGQDDTLRRLIAMGIPLEGRLYQRRGRWFFAATYLNEAKVSEGEHQVVGVDLGRRMRAVAFSPAGNRRLFVSGRAMRIVSPLRERRPLGARIAARALRLRAGATPSMRIASTARGLRFAGAGRLRQVRNFSQTAPPREAELPPDQRLVSHKAASGYGPGGQWPHGLQRCYLRDRPTGQPARGATGAFRATMPMRTSTRPATSPRPRSGRKRSRSDPESTTSPGRP